MVSKSMSRVQFQVRAIAKGEIAGVYINWLVAEASGAKLQPNVMDACVCCMHYKAKVCGFPNTNWF